MSDQELFENTKGNVERASNWSDFKPSGKKQRRLKQAMEEYGVEPEKVRDYMREEYAPTSDKINLDDLVPVMCENLASDIKEGRIK